MKNLEDVLLITVDNDAEARLIYLIALKTGISVYRSVQLHGATLDKETGIVDFAQIMDRPNIWTVEIPGENTEGVLRSCGFHITIIDHHTYRGLDRAHDATGV